MVVLVPYVIKLVECSDGTREKQKLKIHMIKPGVKDVNYNKTSQVNITTFTITDKKKWQHIIRFKLVGT